MLKHHSDLLTRRPRMGFIACPWAHQFYNKLSLANTLSPHVISITSDFGLDPDLPGVHDMPVFAPKKASYEAVKRHAAHNRLTYTLVACGAFLDWCISSGFAGLDLQEKKAFIFGDGNNVIPWTTLDDVGKATANVLMYPQETLNRPVYIHSVFMSQNQILSATKEVLGNEGWKTTYNNMESLLENALADLKAGKISASTFEVQIQYCIATRALAHPWARDDNSLLGLKDWNLEKVKRLIQTIAHKAVWSWSYCVFHKCHLVNWIILKEERFHVIPNPISALLNL